MYKSVKWSECFLTEHDLIIALQKWDQNTERGKYTKGYEYLLSFQRVVKNGGSLSPAQMTQLKRLAKELYSYYTGDYALLSPKPLTFCD